MGKSTYKMRFTLATNYVIPAVLLNPILFLHSLNALLSRLLPPIAIDATLQPPSYYPLGPSAEHPHVDMHANDNLCWSYTLVMVFAQLVAFGRVSRNREEMRERDAQSKELLGNSKQVASGPGIIRRISTREIPLEREAYSSDDDSDGLRKIDDLVNGKEPTNDMNGWPKVLNGHATSPQRLLRSQGMR